MNKRGRSGKFPEAPAPHAAVALELQTANQLRFTKTEMAVGAAVIAAGSALGIWLKENLEKRGEIESDETQLSPAPDSAHFCELGETAEGVLMREERTYYRSGHPRQTRGWYLPNGDRGEVPCYWELSFTNPVETDIGSYGTMIRYDTQAANGGPAQTIVSMDIQAGEGGIMKVKLELTSFKGSEGVDHIKIAFNGKVELDEEGNPSINRKEAADWMQDEMQLGILGFALRDWLNQFAPQGDLAPWLDLGNCPEAQPEADDVPPPPLGTKML